MLARFIAIPHYTYLVLKMSAPCGVLTLYGDLLVSFKCEIATTSSCFSASAIMVAEAKKVAATDLSILEEKHTETAIYATPAMKKVCLGLADPAKMVVIVDG
jgi:hypothetical protein